MAKNLYLSDEQYLALLKRARAKLDNITTIDSMDCTDIGCKHTESNVGLCDENNLVTPDTRMFPNYTSGPQVTHMLYRNKNHICPCDIRAWGGIDDRRNSKETCWLNGCFYTCAVFQELWPPCGLRKKTRRLTIEEIKKLYDRLIEQVEQGRYPNDPTHRGRFVALGAVVCAKLPKGS